jgi:hypothetical protein
MSQFPGAYTDPYAVSPSQPPKTSGLAITSLVLSLILCCPVTTILGALLGAVALVTISAHTARRGKGLAAAAIIIGALATLGWGWLGYQLYTGWKQMQAAPTETLQAGLDGDIAKFKAGFGTVGLAATDVEAQAFLEQVRARYGRINRSEVDIAAIGRMKQSPGQAAVPLQYRLVFEKATMNAELQFDPQNQPRKDRRLVFDSITISDPAQGNLTFP